MNVPQIVCYQGNAVSYEIAKRIVKVDHISLVNLIAGRAVVKELIQGGFNKENLLKELALLLQPGNQGPILEGYRQVKDMLGGRGASGRAAAKMVQYLTEKSVK